MADLLIAATLSSMELLHATAHTLVRSLSTHPLLANSARH